MPGDDGELLVKSYRYLRLALVVLVASLAASIVIERLAAGCWSTSISAYYYTPAHSMFVAALVAIGVCLVVIVGRTVPEDNLLNVAGMLAPIVAFVPTSRPRTVCASSPFPDWDTDAFVKNNLPALVIGGVAALVIAFVSARRDDLTPGQMGRNIRRLVPGFAVSAALMVAGLVWFATARGSFVEYAHGYAALVLFVAIGIVVQINSRISKGAYRTLYRGLVVFMIASAVTIGVVKLLVGEWNHMVLWIEALEIGAFEVFWTAQTFEHWDQGVKGGSTAA